MEPDGYRQTGSGDVVAELERLSTSVGARDGYTAEHACRVRPIAMAIGRLLNLSKAELVVVSQAARFHDVGKLSVPDAVLLKPGRLTSAEWRVMRTHSAEGARTVARLGFCARTAAAVRHHHEHFDGTGYPDGLGGEAIPLAARVIHVADAMDSMTTDRVYRSARPTEEAIAELRQGAGAQFCPRCVEALELVLEQRPRAARPSEVIATR